MLDAYIIDRIRREREQIQRRNTQVPLYIENPEQAPDEPTDRSSIPPHLDRERGREKPERGSVIIDFRL